MEWPEILQVAVKCALPLWWEVGHSGIVLRVQTAQTWTGKVRSRAVWKLVHWSVVYSRTLLLERGAQVDVSAILRLPGGDVDVWQWGWAGEGMSEMRDQVWRAAEAARSTKRYPNWDGYLAYVRGETI